jgi:hypothetical protein
MTDLYSKNNSYPTTLPFRIRLSDGSTRTDPNQFTADDIADAGYVLAPDKPSYNANTHSLGWDGTNWTVNVIPPVVTPRVVSKADMVDLFNDTEYTTILNILDDSANTYYTTVRNGWNRLLVDDQIDRDHPKVAGYLTYLENNGIIEVGRANEILNA